eukprot:2246992-Amphidinium_carterae.1
MTLSESSRRVRGAALKICPFVVYTPDDGSEVTFSTPRRDSPPSSRRSVADIQRKIIGGCAKPARKCLLRRFAASRRFCVTVSYSPQRAGDCLFAVLRSLCQDQYGRTMSTALLRKTLHRLFCCADPVEVEKCASQFRFTREEYIRTARLHRWGTSYDLKLLAEELGQACRLINRHNGACLFSSAGSAAQRVIGFRDSHFP